MSRKAGVVLSDEYQIFETDIFMNDLEERQSSIRERFKLKLKTHVYVALKQQPYFGRNIKKLLNYNPETWRYRIGAYRIFYTIHNKEKVVAMLAVSDRKDAY